MTVSYGFDDNDCFEFIEIFHKEGLEHNLLGPSYVSYQKNGLKYEERWEILGRLHRTDGPARVVMLFGEMKFELFLLHDISYIFTNWSKRVKGKIDKNLLAELKRKHKFD